MLKRANSFGRGYFCRPMDFCLECNRRIFHNHCSLFIEIWDKLTVLVTFWAKAHGSSYGAIFVGLWILWLEHSWRIFYNCYLLFQEMWDKLAFLATFWAKLHGIIPAILLLRSIGTGNQSCTLPHDIPFP